MSDFDYEEEELLKIKESDAIRKMPGTLSNRGCLVLDMGQEEGEAYYFRCFHCSELHPKLYMNTKVEINKNKRKVVRLLCSACHVD